MRRADPMQVTATGLAALYAVLAPLHLILLTGTTRTVMAALATAGAALLGAAAVWLHRHPAHDGRPEVAWSVTLAAVPLANTLVHTWLAGDLMQTTSLMLVVVGVGASIRSGRAVCGLVAVACAGWAAAALRLLADGYPRGATLHHAVGLAMAVALAAVLHRARRTGEAALRQEAAGSEADRARLEAARDELRRSEDLLAGAERLAGLGSWELDVASGRVTWSDQMHELLGVRHGDLPPALTAFDAVVHPQDLPGMRRSLRSALADGREFRVDFRVVRPDGGVRHVQGYGQVHRDPDGAAVVAQGTALDVTERVETEQALLETQADLGAIARVVRRLHSGLDPREAIVQAALEITGAATAHLVEPDGAQRLGVTASAGYDLVGRAVALRSPSAAAESFTGQAPVFLADPAASALAGGEDVPVERARSLMCSPVRSAGEVIGVLAVTWAQRVPDMSRRSARAASLLADEAGVALEAYRLKSHLQELATTDTLTGLANRRAWDTALRIEIERARRTGVPLTVAIADLDRFKVFNDTHGHAAGDRLLAGFAQQARQALRLGDVLARWGGEEFAIALPGCDRGDAGTVLERLLTAVPQDQTCSIGHATWDGTESTEELVRRADLALYRAKATGRARSVPAEDAPVEDVPVEQADAVDEPVRAGGSPASLR